MSDVRSQVLDLVAERATRAALRGTGLSPLMVNTVTEHFLRYGNPDGSLVQVGVVTVAAEARVHHTSVAAVRRWLVEQKIAHVESVARKGHKAVWWHVWVPVDGEECPTCAGLAGSREDPRVSPEDVAQEDSLEDVAQETDPLTHLPSPEDDSRGPLLRTTPEDLVLTTKRTKRPEQPGSSSAEEDSLRSSSSASSSPPVVAREAVSPPEDVAEETTTKTNDEKTEQRWWRTADEFSLALHATRLLTEAGLDPEEHRQYAVRWAAGVSLPLPREPTVAEVLANWKRREGDTG